MAAWSDVGAYFTFVRPVSQRCLIDAEQLTGSADTDPARIGIDFYSRCVCRSQKICQNLSISSKLLQG